MSNKSSVEHQYNILIDILAEMVMNCIIQNKETELPSETKGEKQVC